MEEKLRSIKQQSLSKATENKKFFQKLKKNPPKYLDAIMQELHNEVFGYTNCLNCANCCKTTGPLFTSKDISRLAKHFKIKSSQFIDQYLRVDEDGDHVLLQTPCPFLGHDNYCSVYDQRPKACREYPHTDRHKFEQIGHLTRKNVAMCPAAFDVVEKLKKVV